MTAVLEGGPWSAARPGRILPRERTGTHFTGDWVGPRAGLDGRKISSTPGFDTGLTKAKRTRIKFLLHFLFLLLLLFSSLSCSFVLFFKGEDWIRQLAALSEVQKFRWSSQWTSRFHYDLTLVLFFSASTSFDTPHIFTWRHYFFLLPTHRVNTLSVMGTSVQSAPPKKKVRSITSWSAWALPCQKKCGN